MPAEDMIRVKRTAVAICIVASLATGCLPFLEMGGYAGLEGTNMPIGMTVPIPMTPKPFDYRGAASETEVWLAQFTSFQLWVRENKWELNGLGVGKAWRADTNSAWRTWAAGVGIVEYTFRTSDGYPLGHDQTLGAFVDVGTYRFKWGGIKARLMLVPNAGPNDANLSGVSVSYWWGYWATEAIVEVFSWLRGY